MDEKSEQTKSVEKKPQVVFILGGPGAGKGTQCQKIVEEFSFVHLSAGELLREEKKSGSKDADLINRCMSEGKIVPVEITIKLLKKAMEMNVEKGKYLFLIDGFPRNEDNWNGWNKKRWRKEYWHVHKRVMRNVLMIIVRRLR